VTLVRFDLNRLTPTAWKNGGGQTREIVRMPAGSTMDTFDWRASVAEIAASGPFSTFPGIDRVLVLLSGDGVHLRSLDGSIDHQLSEPSRPFAFAGERSIEASLLGGASSDFNIMSRRATMRAVVEVVVANRTLAPSSAGVLFAARGEWDVQSTGDGKSGALSLDESSGVWWDGEMVAWEVTPRATTGALIAARVHQRSASLDSP
jgi:environmental stress-induced protein Ves